MNADMRARLEELAKEEAWADKEGFYVRDYAGDNYDDAYSGGCRDGEILLAREIIDAGPIGHVEDLAPTPVATSMAPVQDESYWMRRCAHAEARLAALETYIAGMAEK